MRFGIRFVLVLARRCQCLGQLTSKDLARRALDLFCRNETGPIVNSTTADPQTGLYPKEFFPTKNRCGSNDPVDMTAQTQCACKDKDGEGAKEGIWMNVSRTESACVASF